MDVRPAAEWTLRIQLAASRGTLRLPDHARLTKPESSVASGRVPVAFQTSMLARRVERSRSPAFRANQVRRRETGRGPSRYKSRCPQVAVLDFVAGNLRRKERSRKLSDQQRVVICSAPSSATAAQ
jgi:hypothetical protein